MFCLLYICAPCAYTVPGEAREGDGQCEYLCGRWQPHQGSARTARAYKCRTSLFFHHLFLLMNGPHGFVYFITALLLGISKDLHYFWYIIISLNDKNYLRKWKRVKLATFNNNLEVRQKLEGKLPSGQLTRYVRVSLNVLNLLNWIEIMKWWIRTRWENFRVRRPQQVVCVCNAGLRCKELHFRVIPGYIVCSFLNKQKWGCIREVDCIESAWIQKGGQIWILAWCSHQKWK